MSVWRSIVAASLCACVLFSPVAPLAFAEDTAEVKKLKEQMAAMQAEMAKMKAEMADMKSGQPAVTGPAQGKEGQMPTSKKVWIKPYGFIHVQYIYDSNRTNDRTQASWVNRDTGQWDLNSASPRVNPETNIHARLTRLGLDLKGDNVADMLWDASLEGKIEVDFFGPSSESRNEFRMRHAYVKASWSNGLSFLAGQTSDIISPLWPTAEPNIIGWNGGNLGDRRPQFRAEWTHALWENASITLQGAVLRTEAVGAQDADADGNNDGTDSASPMFQGRVALSFPNWVKGEKVMVGASGHYATEKTNTEIPVGGLDPDDKFVSDSFNVDLVFPVWKGIVRDDDLLQIKGEWWTGKNLNDVRGGIGQGVNTTFGGINLGDAEEIDAMGGWIEAMYKFNKVWTVYGGFSMDEPEDEDLPLPTSAALFNSTRRHNQYWYVTNDFQLGGGTMFSVRYMRMTTDYWESEAENDRWIGMVQWNF